MSVTVGTLRAKTFPQQEGEIMSLVLCFHHCFVRRDDQTQVKFFLYCFF